MFRQDQTALLSIQLLLMCYVHTEKVKTDYRNLSVSRGDSIMLTCNILSDNVTQINWTKGRFYFVYTVLQNLSFSNFTSHTFRIEPNSVLNIFNVQHEDTGLYTCYVTDRKGVSAISWNLTVSEKPRGISPSWHLLYILIPVIGFVICGLTLTISVCRKCWTGTPQKDSHDSRTLSYVQFVRLKEENYLYSSSAIKLCSIQRELREESI